MKKKPEDTLFIRSFYRFMGNFIAKKISKTKISPNQVTFFGLLIGILASCLILTKNYHLLIIAGIFLQLNVICDFVDGSLAHLTSKETILGDWLDSNTGILVDSFLFFAIGLNLHLQKAEAAVWIMSFLCLTWRYLIRNIYFTFHATGFFDDGIRETRKNFLFRVLREFIPTRYLILLLASLALIFNQLYGFLILVSSYGGIGYLGLWIAVYKRIAKSESTSLHQK